MLNQEFGLPCADVCRYLPSIRRLTIKIQNKGKPEVKNPLKTLLIILYKHVQIPLLQFIQENKNSAYDLYTYVNPSNKCIYCVRDLPPVLNYNISTTRRPIIYRKWESRGISRLVRWSCIYHRAERFWIHPSENDANKERMLLF